MKKILNRLHEHFIPSERNAFQPHFLRLKIAAGILGVVLLLEAIYLAASFVIIPRSDYLAAIFASVLIEQTNEERVADDLNGLVVNDTLVKVAQMKADDMAAKGYFAHNSPDGKTPWYWFKEAGYDYAAAGENLAVNFTDSKDVTNAWMHSPTHRANILNGNYTEIGIATAQGVYKGRNVIFVVQEFGRPALIARETSKATTAKDVFEAAVDSSVRTIPAPTSVPEQDTPEAEVAPVVLSVAEDRSLQLVATPSPRAIAGAETQKIEVVIKDPDDPKLGSTTPSSVSVGKVAALLASPRNVMTTVYLVLLGIILLALGLAVFIKIRIQHPHIIANGVLLIAIIASLIIFNIAVGSWQGMI